MLYLPRELTAPYRKQHVDRFVARAPFMLNESVEQGKLAANLPYIPAKADEVFFGVAGLRSLDLLCQSGKYYDMRHQKAVLFDINTNQAKAMNACLYLIKHSQTPEEFIQAFAHASEQWMKAIPRQKHKHQTDEDRKFFSIMGLAIIPRRKDEIKALLMSEQRNEQSWLHPSNFSYIKQMVERGDIDTILWDITDDTRTRAIREWLEKNELTTGTLYLSSMLEFIDPEHMFDYFSRVKAADVHTHAYKNLLDLLQPNSRILTSESFSLEEQKKRAKEIEGKNEVPVMFELRLHDKPWLEKLSSTVHAVEGGQRKFRYNFIAGNTPVAIQDVLFRDSEGKPIQHPDKQQRFIFILDRHLEENDLRAIYNTIKNLGYDMDEKASKELRAPVFIIPSHMLMPSAVKKVFGNIENEMQAQLSQAAPAR